MATTTTVSWDCINYSSEFSDDIGGTSAGLAYEWEMHNIAYDLLCFLEKFGVEVEAEKKKAKDVDVGYTIFSDNHRMLSVVMWGGDTFSNIHI